MSPLSFAKGWSMPAYKCNAPMQLQSSQHLEALHMSLELCSPSTSDCSSKCEVVEENPTGQYISPGLMHEDHHCVHMRMFTLHQTNTSRVANANYHPKTQRATCQRSFGIESAMCYRNTLSWAKCSNMLCTKLLLEPPFSSRPS